MIFFTLKTYNKHDTYQPELSLISVGNKISKGGYYYEGDSNRRR